MSNINFRDAAIARLEGMIPGQTVDAGEFCDLLTTHAVIETRKQLETDPDAPIAKLEQKLDRSIVVTPEALDAALKRVEALERALATLADERAALRGRVRALLDNLDPALSALDEWLDDDERKGTG